MNEQQYVNMDERYGNAETVTIEDYRELNVDGTFEVRADGIYEEVWDEAEAEDDGKPFRVNVRWHKVARLAGMTREEARKMVSFYGGTVYAEDDNRWFKVYAFEPGSERIVFEAGYEMMPADFREEFTDVDAALDELEGLVGPDAWQQGE